MFSILGQMLAPNAVPRQAEQTDTRQHIQRHDPDAQRRKKGQGEHADDTTDELEGATVAVIALYDFLVNFLQAKSPAAEPAQALGTSEPAASPAVAPTHTVRSVAANRAASAYQHTAEAGQRRVLIETTDERAGGPAYELNAEDTRAIHGLIADLKTLQEGGIEYLHIARAETFLQSLINAVNAAKAARTN